MQRRHGASLFLLLFSGCVRPGPAPPRAADTQGAPITEQRRVEHIVHPHPGVEDSRSPAEALSARPLPRRDRFATRRIGASPTLTQPASPPRVGPRDIRVNRTRIDNAMRLLAEAGKFHLIIDRPIPQLLTAQFRGVEPYDALLSIAEAHGIHVRYAGGSVLLTKGPPDR